MKRIYVDYRKCLACKACEIACAVEHHPARSLMAALYDRKSKVNIRVLGIDEESFPLSCRHCDPADCLTACPSGAISRDPVSGAVLLDEARCKACAMCAAVCAFDVISIRETHASPHGRDSAFKCDLCRERVQRGEQPACIEACHSGALVYGEQDPIREQSARGTLRAYLLGEGKLPPYLELFRELRRQEFARRRGDDR